MDIQELKDKIKIDNKIHHLLNELGMKHIKDMGDYFSCGMPDGDNKSSTIIYKDSLFVEAYTRDISDKNNKTDIISLVSFINKSFFSNSVKWICDTCEYDYYGEKEEIPMGLKWMRDISKLSSEDEIDNDNEKIRPLKENILKYYRKIQNIEFEKDGIDLWTQKIFEIGMDLETHRITIPIRDEIGTLVGVKGRIFGKDNISDMKYMYLFKCPKSKILFGLDKTYPYIMRSRVVYIFESEKAVMQMWSKGIKNCVAVGNHKISKRQTDILTRLGVDIIFCYDKEIGVKKDDNGDLKIKNNTLFLDKDFWIRQTRRFINGQKYGIMYDRYNILENKQSPSDDYSKFELLKSNIVWKYKKGGNDEV